MKLELEGVATEKTQEEMAKYLKYLVYCGGNPKKVVTVKDIAYLESVAISRLRAGGAERYLLPRFGQSAYPTGVTRWPFAEYDEWSAKDPEERRQAYLEHLRQQAKAYVKRTEKEKAGGF